MNSADSENENNPSTPCNDRELPLGVLSPRQLAVSDLLRWGVDVAALRAGGATDAALVELHDNLARLAAKYGYNLEEDLPR